MKKQPENKATIKVGEINRLCCEKSNTIETINQIIGKFDIRNKIKVLDDLKTRGFKIAELLAILIVMPFYRLRIDNMGDKDRGQKQGKAKKDTYYNLKNNELIDWRLVLKVMVRQFCILTQGDHGQGNGKTTAFIADDTTAMKTGLKIEYISKVFDHTINNYLFGFKIMVLGWFDGTTFIPVDFSIHREKGHGSQKEWKKQQKVAKKLDKTTQQYKEKEQEIKARKNQGAEIKKRQNQTGKILKKELQQNQKQTARIAKQLKEIKKQIEAQKKEYSQLKSEYKQSRKQHPLFGLKPKQRKEQFKKGRIKNSPGFKRAQEVDTKKTDNTLKMLRRSVKAGIKAYYFLADSWFFSTKMVQGVRNVLEGLNYLGMVPQRETILFSYKGKEVNSKYLYKENKNCTHRCRKYRSKYIQINVEMEDIPLQLFFVKMGRAKNWKLLATTDLSLDFIRLFELYQIRWSIEVFFKECKQYLGLGKCQSRDFDAQICSTTLTMVQYILLCYYKRIHYQQKLDGIFEEISYQTMEASIVEKLMEKFIELLGIIADTVGVEPIELYIMLMRNPKAIKVIKELKLEDFMEQKNAA